MRESLKLFFSLPRQGKKDVLEAAATRLRTLPSYVEKDIWVCIVLDVLFNHLPDGHPRLLFKGGTSLSKAFGLIERFSEDIDLVINREDLGLKGEHDPTQANAMSGKKRRTAFKELKAMCSNYIQGELLTALTTQIAKFTEVFDVKPDEDSSQTLFVEYPTLFANSGMAYVMPRVKIEAGAMSALNPNLNCTVTPYIANEPSDWSFGVKNIRVIAPERTYLDKLLILHGTYCRFRDVKNLPVDKDRISRHYYDVAMITTTNTGQSALCNVNLLNEVRHHACIAFPRAWMKLEEAVPGSLNLVPQQKLRTVIEQDYDAMRDMIHGNVPEFRWIMN